MTRVTLTLIICCGDSYTEEEEEEEEDYADLMMFTFHSKWKHMSPAGLGDLWEYVEA